MGISIDSSEIAAKVVYGGGSPYWKVTQENGCHVVTFTHTDFKYKGLSYPEIHLALKQENFYYQKGCIYTSPAGWGPCGASSRCEEGVKTPWLVVF